MKKIVYLLFVCAICGALVLTACSNNGSGASGEAAEEAATGEAAEGAATGEAAEGTGAEESTEEGNAEADLSQLIIGTWEGHCTSEESAYDDGQDHRWQYNADGTYVYYIKDGENWVPGDDTMNEYSVDGNVLDTRWGDSEAQYSEAWEIAIDGDTMNWTAEREKDDGTTYTVTFEMKRVE